MGWFLEMKVSIQTASLLYRTIDNKLKKQRIHEIIIEAVEIEKSLFPHCLKILLRAFPSWWFSKWVCLNRLIYVWGFHKVLRSHNPFKWIDMISCRENNFVERRLESIEDRVFRFDADFCIYVYKLKFKLIHQILNQFYKLSSIVSGCYFPSDMAPPELLYFLNFGSFLLDQCW